MPQGGQQLGQMSRIIELGTANISNTIHIPSNSHVRIEGTLTRTANVPMLAVDEYVGTNNQSIRIEIDGNGTLDGNGYDADMIQIYNSVANKYHDFRLKNFSGNGIYINGQSGALYRSFYNKFHHIHFGEMPGSGIAATKAFIYNGHYAIDNTYHHLTGSAAGTTIGDHQHGFYFENSNAWIERCHFDKPQTFFTKDTSTIGGDLFIINCMSDSPMTHGIDLGDNWTRMNIIHTKFYNTPAGYSDLYDSDGGTPTHYDLLIHGCEFQGTTKEYSINLTGTGHRRVRLHGNNFYAGTVGYINGTVNEKIGNMYYTAASPYILKDMNNGTQTGNGAQQTIPHGLGAIPTRVILSENTTGAALPKQTAAADITNIYVTAVNAKDYNWLAIT